MVPIGDPKQKAIISVFSKLIYTSLIVGDTLLYMLCVCVLVEMTLDDGINEFSAKAFATLATTVVIAQQDFKTAQIFIDIALSMLRKFGGMHASETTFISYLTLCWTNPIEECTLHMLESVPEGLRSGDMENALWIIFCVDIAYPYVLGKPIPSVLKECSKVVVQCEDASQAAHAGGTKILWQMFRNLSNSSCQNPAELEGDIFSAANNKETDIAHVGFTIFAQGELSLLLLDYETTAKRALDVGDKYEKLVPNPPVIMIETFSRAVALYAAAIRTKKRKYRVEARRLYKKILHWAEKGNPNFKYYLLFLEAEQLVLSNKPDLAEEKYEEALKVAAEEGRLHHLGLINERYAEFLGGRGPRKQQEADERLQEAVRYYREWGAEAKVKLLETKM